MQPQTQLSKRIIGQWTIGEKTSETEDRISFNWAGMQTKKWDYYAKEPERISLYGLMV